MSGSIRMTLMTVTNRPQRQIGFEASRAGNAR